MAAGSSATYGVAVTGGEGFADPVSLTVDGLPANATGTFTPEVIAGTGASTLEVTTSATTPVGDHLLTVTGTGGSRRHTMTVTLVVTRAAETMLHLTRNAAGKWLTETAPVATAAKFADSRALTSSRGNRWSAIGTWKTEPGTLPGRFVSSRDLDVWLGLRSSDDQGTAFDLRAELSVDGTIVASGEAICATGLTRAPRRAKGLPIELHPEPGSGDRPEGDLALTLSARIGTGDCPGHASARGVRLYYGSSTRDSSLVVVSEF